MSSVAVAVAIDMKSITWTTYLPTYFLRYGTGFIFIDKQNRIEWNGMGWTGKMWRIWMVGGGICRAVGSFSTVIGERKGEGRKFGVFGEAGRRRVGVELYEIIGARRDKYCDGAGKRQRRR
jgi:hypothetical protein